MSEMDDEQEPWIKRPQDDRRRRSALGASTAKRRAENPPFTCWTDDAETIDLFIDGRHRAQVLPSSALARLYDPDGNDAGSFTLLWSECPYAAVEHRLGIERVAEVRDESIDGGGIVSPLLREAAERGARAFRESHSAVGEAAHYLERAAAVADLLGMEPSAERQIWRRLINRALDALTGHNVSMALELTESALVGIDRDAILDWQVAWVDCERGAEALRRILLAQATR
ncbi:hypothetical protein HT585_14015 [Ensifer sp. HO-A22]|uniref:Uncharacterized protein n=1 Tax=Ensifer oleiphilus TaxID=2742698 RepID=A0A7Y6UNA6_9HYPH|nr:hypothetical protein [Ensifer oleiphilus]NVD39977.1 hypothetical protein [Ensifer oleiphilus]